MKKVYIAIAAVLLAAASVATVFVVRSHNRMDDFFRANVNALTDVEDQGGKAGHHYETCGALFYKYGYLEAYCINPIKVCDRYNQNGCEVTVCTNHR